jgi:GT2 family glycosyltransferase
MPVATIDVVIPVWNRPNETRNCLVNLINHTPEARFIMMDCGSDRETEKLLQEFADGLDERALLMRDDSNIGYVRAANRGFDRSEAPYIALVRNTTEVCAGWLEPLLRFASTHPEAGILVPQLSPGGIACSQPIEVASASFAAMVISREAFQQLGGFDETMDGGVWCLKDYTRRACALGFFTYLVPGPAVICQEEVQLGSERRREENLRRSIELFRERWGEGASYLVHVPKGVEPEHFRQKLDWLVKGARHGDRYQVLLPAALYKAAQQGGFDLLHENIRLVALPRFSTDTAKRRVYARIAAENPGIVPVAAVDGIAFPWSDSFLPFTELSERIRLGYPH